MVSYPKDWEEKKLGNIIDLYDNLRVPVSKDKRTHGRTPYYGANGIQDHVLGYTHYGEFVLLAEDGANSLTEYPIKYITGKAWINNHAHVISGKSNIASTKFLSYALKKINYENILVGGTRAKLNGKTLKNIVVVIPPLPEQQAIADAFTAFDMHISNLSRLIEKKKMIRDGAVEDLVSGKRRLAGFSGKWEECELNKLADIFDGTHQTPKYTLTGVPFVSVENITNLYNTDKFISESDFELEFKNIPEKGDILMTRIGDIGTASIVTRNSKLAYYVSLALFKHIKIYSEFLLYYIHSSAFQKELFDRSLNFAIPKKINKGEIGKCNVHFPTDIVEQQAIADILTSMDKEISDLEEEKEKYIALKAGAMDDLLTGKIRLV